MGKPVEEDHSGGEKTQDCDGGQDVGYVVGFSGLHNAGSAGRSFVDVWSESSTHERHPLNTVPLITMSAIVGICQVFLNEKCPRPA
jgi:hypothetical protein